MRLPMNGFEEINALPVGITSFTNFPFSESRMTGFDFCKKLRVIGYPDFVG